MHDAVGLTTLEAQGGQNELFIHAMKAYCLNRYRVASSAPTRGMLVQANSSSITFFFFKTFSYNNSCILGACTNIKIIYTNSQSPNNYLQVIQVFDPYGDRTRETQCSNQPLRQPYLPYLVLFHRLYFHQYQRYRPSLCTARNFSIRVHKLNKFRVLDRPNSVSQCLAQFHKLLLVIKLCILRSPLLLRRLEPSSWTNRVLLQAVKDKFEVNSATVIVVYCYGTR